MLSDENKTLDDRQTTFESKLKEFDQWRANMESYTMILEDSVEILNDRRRGGGLSI